MKLTSYTNYAMRCLQLAALKSPDLVRIDDVVEIHRISRPHIVKVVHQLGKAGYLETVRGRNGGFRLGRPAESITVGEVVRVTEGPLELVECFNAQTNTCPLIGLCELSAKIKEATAAFMAVLDSTSVADIVRNRSQLLERVHWVDASN